VLRQHNTAHLLMTGKERARIQPEAESTLGFAHRFLETCMGETLLLPSCGAAFVIAAASLFG
jgi:hypothetical protein